MPLRHLIALIINAHPLGSGPLERSFENSSIGWTLIRKTSLSSDRSDGVRSSSRHKTAARDVIVRDLHHGDKATFRCSEIARRSRLASRSTLGAILPLHDVRYRAPA